MSWFWRGFQSAIFYYVSCAPCTKLAYQRKRRKQNRREKAEHAAIEEVSPEFYQHPSPFSTNIYWREEMVLGPGPPPKKGDRNNKSKNGSTRELNTGGYGSSAGASSADSTLVVESLDGLSPVQEAASEQGWNTRRYQRPDEILWGFDLEAGGMPSINPTGTSGSGTYYTARNPAVNDLHPPVVSTQPTRKSETRWMLQPPPSAKVMEGKARTPRSRSVSGASHGSGRALALGRQVGERALEEKVRRRERAPAEEEVEMRIAGDEVREAVGGRPLGQPHDREAKAGSPVRREQAPRSGTFVADDPSHNIIQLPTAENTPLRSSPSTMPSPPQTTTASTPNTHRSPTTTTKPPPPPPPPHPLSTHPSASSLLVLQELTSPSPFSSALNARSPVREAGVCLPQATELEDWALRLPVLESRFPGREGFVFERGEEGGEEIGRLSEAR
ncbi:hypothetical protein MMC26_006282 [Xylographa opegraphella]|nr:hypothetical protein [Xylographa opegraphella]